MKSLTRFNPLLACIAISLVSTACFDMGNNGRRLSQIVRLDNTGGTSGAVDNTKMWLNVTAGSKILKVHRVSDPSTSLVDPSDYTLPCEITVSGSALDYVCIAEAEELDTFFNGVTINYNIPGTSCSYGRVTPYWYFKWQVGQGAKFHESTYAQNGTTSFRVTYNADGTGLAAPAASEQSYLQEKCPYDYSTFGGPNCCLGTYTAINKQETTTIGVYQTSTVVGKPWGGDAGKCVDGPGADSKVFSRHPQFKIPMPIYKNIETAGISGEIKAASPYTQLYSSNIYVANFFNPADHGATSPRPLQGITFTNPLEFTGIPSDSYMFECLDKSAAIKHRIRLYIREWNEKSELDLFISGSAGDSDTVINDYKDWKDMSPGAAGAYPQSIQ